MHIYDGYTVITIEDRGVGWTYYITKIADAIGMRESLCINEIKSNFNFKPRERPFYYRRVEFYEVGPRSIGIGSLKGERSEKVLMSSWIRGERSMAEG